MAVPAKISALSKLRVPERFRLLSRQKRQDRLLGIVPLEDRPEPALDHHAQHVNHALGPATLFRDLDQ